MKATTEQARRLLPFFKSLAQRAGLDTRDIKLSISYRHKEPYQVGGTIYLPVLPSDLYPKTFLHELQHARDCLDGTMYKLSLEELERRAQRAERFG